MQRTGYIRWDDDDVRFILDKHTLQECYFVVHGNYNQQILGFALPIPSQPVFALDYQIGSWCFSTIHASLRSQSKDWLARNRESESEYLLIVVSVNKWWHMWNPRLYCYRFLLLLNMKQVPEKLCLGQWPYIANIYQVNAIDCSNRTSAG
jgi:hypothetical protein